MVANWWKDKTFLRKVYSFQAFMTVGKKNEIEKKLVSYFQAEQCFRICHLMILKDSVIFQKMIVICQTIFLQKTV